MPDLPVIWVTGAGGLIGAQVVRLAARFAPSWRVISLIRDRLDLTDFNAVHQAFRADSPQAIIHCAAISKATECASNPGLARRINVEATALLAELACDRPFIFFSSDLVFDGQTGNYDEHAAVNPLNLYGETKAAAEQVVLANPRHTVIRTSLNAGVSARGDRSFTEDLRRNWERGNVPTLFQDEYRCPLAATITAQAVWTILALNLTGLYHVAGSERLSRWDIGQLMARRWPALHPRIQAASVRDYPGPPRPADTSLNCGKIGTLLPFPLPKFSEWLAARPEADL